MKKTLCENLKSLSLIIIGTAALAFGTAVFMLPYDIVAGGISGIAIIVEKFVPSEKVSAELIIGTLTWILFFFGYFALGRGFAAKTFVSSLFYPPFLSLFSYLAREGTLGGYFYLPSSEYADIGILIAALSGGALVGLGCALAFLGGGSTGGTDIIALTLCKLFPRLKSSKVIFIIDASIVTLGMFVIRNLVVSLMGIIAAFVTAALIDKVFLGAERAFVASIVSDEYEKINSLIIEKLNRTTTIITARGGYSGKDKRIVSVSFSISEYSDILSLVTSADPRAFVTVQRAHEISGEGWSESASFR